MKLSRPLAAVSLMLMLVLVTSVNAQKKISKPASGSTNSSERKNIDKVADEKKVKDIVAFLEYMLNTLGNKTTPIRDKEVLITESYAKIFRDSKVQIEDDLDTERAVVTNKDIVAYLKDVNFFFTDARFEFTIEGIEERKLPSGDLFYKVSSTRNLTASTLDRTVINTSIARYIEINYSPKEDDLKIVSIYTNGIDEKRTLTIWWNELSYEWRSIFKRKLSLPDSVSLKDIKAITAIDELDLSNNHSIQNLMPLGQLSNLHSLNLAGTTIVDLIAIRNLTELKHLNLAHTEIKDLTPLKYSSKLENLNLSHSKVYNIDVVGKMPDLKSLDLSSTSVSDFTPIGKLNRVEKLNLRDTKISNLIIIEKFNLLTDLDLSGTKVLDLNPLGSINSLVTLSLDSTQVNDLLAISNMTNLKLLNINHTAITSLKPLFGLKKLEKVYCDQTPIQHKDADAFRSENPNVLVVFDSNDLKIWWETLPSDWRHILQDAAAIQAAPTKDELAKIQLLDSISVGKIESLPDLEPLKRLQKLKVINVSGTNINDLSPLQQHKEITYLDISHTKVRDIGALRNSKTIKVIKANSTPLENIEYYSLPGLEKLYADCTRVNDRSAREFLEKNPQCLLVFKTDQLEQWWQTLSYEWRDIFKKQNGGELPSTPENLHALTEKESVQIQDAAISNLSGLNEFFRLKELKVLGTAMNSITPLSPLTGLKSLQVSGNPLREIDSLYLLKDLEELDISNTPLDDIYPLWRLKNLKRLNFSGTQISELDVLERLENLEYLNCSNTSIKKLNALDYLPIRILKCYNTRLSARSIEHFKATHPDCDVQYYK